MPDYHLELTPRHTVRLVVHRWHRTRPGNVATWLGVGAVVLLVVWMLGLVQGSNYFLHGFCFSALQNIVLCYA